MCASALAITAAATPADAVQASGDDVPAYSNGWSWTYATSFRYLDTVGGTDVTINENVTYTVADVETFQGQPAYKENITGTITGGSGTANVDSVGAIPLKNFAGTVSGTRFLRQSDLALLQENQQQHLTGSGTYVLTIPITADINLALTPTPGLKNHDFPLNAGDSWQDNESIDYTGGFNYSSSVASGSSPFVGTLPLVGSSTVSSANVSVPIGSNIPTDKVVSASSDGQTSDTTFWSPTYQADAQEVLQLPLDGASLTITRNLSGSTRPAASPSLTESITPSLSCAGGPVTVTGKLSSGASGVPVSIALDKSSLNPGQSVTTSTTTGAGGTYSATLTAPSESDGFSKNGTRANWGVVASAGGTTAAATLVVTPQDCSKLAYSGDTSATTGSNATVKATLTDLATGAGVSGKTVTFALSGGGTVNATTDGNGVATTTLPVTGNPRPATLTTSYAGTSALAAATATTPFDVQTIATTTAVTATPSSVTVGDTATLAATVTPASGTASPDGTVQFLVDGNTFGSPVTLSGGTASIPLNTGPLSLANHTVTAVYSGSTTYASSTAPSVNLKVHQPLLATTTTETVTPSSSVFGQDVTIGATVAANTGGGTPTGSVTFTDGGTTLGTVGLDGAGTASLDASTLAVGSHAIVATYSGDDTYDASTQSKNATVTKASVNVTIDSSDTTVVSGQAVSFTANVAAQAPSGATPSGSVQLVIDGANVGDPVDLAGGVATFPTVTSLLAGSHTVAAVYAATAGFQGGSDSVHEDVTKADTATSVVATPSPSNEDQNIVFTASVAAVAPGSGAPTGTIVFTADGDTIGVASLHATDTGSEASVNVPDLAPGSYTIVASYAGDGSYGASDSAPISQTVIAGIAIVPTTTTATSSENPSTYGGLITFDATVVAQDGSSPSGGVQFSVDGTNFGDPVPVGSDGTAQSASLASPDPGDHTVIASFVGDPGFSNSGDIITQTVASAGVDLGVTSSNASSSYGQGVTFTATVDSRVAGTGSPTGFVQFNVDGQPVGDAVEVADGGATSHQVSDLLPGAHTVSAVYSGDVHFASALTTIAQHVAKVGTTTTLSASATSTSFGQAVTLTAKVAPAAGALGAPSGTVSFVDGSTTLATVPVAPGAGQNGTASTTVNLAAGSHAIKAVYSGSDSFEASSSAATTVSVAKLASKLVADGALVKLLPLGLPLGQLRATLTSSSGAIAGVPVVFKIGNTVACTSSTDANGVANCNALSQLLPLTLNLGYTASYAGDANHESASARGALIK